MNRNTETFFSDMPQTHIGRSKFEMNHTVSFSASNGDLIPFEVTEVLPGDTFQYDTAFVHRMTTPIYPTMDNMVIDYYYFFVPNRLIWEHWAELNGENTTTHWEQPIEYEVPVIKAPEGGWEKGTIADYMGIPTKVPNIKPIALPFRAYTLIWNEWFRDQNLKDPAMVNKDDATVTGSNSGDYVINAQLGAKPLKVAKNHDYFTSRLPGPLKSRDVLIPIGGMTGTVDVIGNGMTLGLTNGTSYGGITVASSGAVVGLQNIYGKPVGSVGATNLDYNKSLGVTTEVGKSGMIVNLNQEGTNSTINALRQAFAVQRLLERDRRSGTRLSEVIRAHFGTISPDARMQRPEYLGGGVRIPVNISQVLQTSSTDSTSPQGNTGAYSHTADSSSNFTHSFTEHGWIIGLMATRIYQHTYQQGLERFWNRRTRFDYYWPALANIGEQAILNKEIYAQGNEKDDEVFGYQEAWADYRYKPNRVAGALRSNYDQPLDSWHYADYYTELPKLSSEWIDEGVNEVDRTLTVQSNVEDQYIVNIAMKVDATRAMPLYSVPGMMDHN